MVLMKNEPGIERGGVKPSSCHDGVSRPSQYSRQIHVSTQPLERSSFPNPAASRFIQDDLQGWCCGSGKSKAIWSGKVR